MSAKIWVCQPPCHTGDIIVRVNSTKSLLAKYLVLSECLSKTTLTRSHLVWPDGDPNAYQYDVLVLWADQTLMSQVKPECPGMKLRVFFHSDELRIVQALSEVTESMTVSSVETVV